MLDLASAARIAYPLRDPVVADTAQHYADMDRRDAYEAEISRRVCDLLETPADIIDGMDDPERILLNLNLAAMLHGTEPSQDRARLELRALLTNAARREAEAEYKAWAYAAAEAAAIARWERRMERCEAWA